MHYWSFDNGQMEDRISSAHMTQGDLTVFTHDIYGNQNSALALNGGWIQVPSGIYFNAAEFTISAWILPKDVGYYARLIDFGNGPDNDNIILSISYKEFIQPTLHIFSGSNYLVRATSPTPLVLDKWQFLAATFNGTNSRIYIDGILTVDWYRNYTLPIVERTQCFIGKSNWDNDDFSYSYIDDLRIHNKALNEAEIDQLMKNE
jgi:hypothetical protein